MKNVRRRGAFGGFIWKEPKQYRDEDVRICGVVTDFQDGHARPKRGARSQQQILGETSSGRLMAIASQVKELARELELQLEFEEMTSNWQKGLGAWHLDFDDRQYLDPTASYLGTFERARRLRQHLGDMPDWAKGLSASRHGPHMGGRMAERIMRGWLGSDHLSRPRLFLFALLYLIAVAKDGSYVVGETKEELLRLMFVDTSDVGLRHPLGLYDPIGTVYAVIETVDKLVSLNRSVLERCSEFRLRGMGILQAKGTLPIGGSRASNRWFTLLAYCGDCGRTPLWAGDLEKEMPYEEGNDEHGFTLCESCRYLKCSDCAFCSYECPRPVSQPRPR